MVIQENSEEPEVDAVLIVPCRSKGDNQIEMSQAAYSAGIRSFIIDRNCNPPTLTETSAPDRCHWKIPETVVALVGQQIPNTENEPIHLTPEQVKRDRLDAYSARAIAKTLSDALNDALQRRRSSGSIRAGVRDGE